MENAALNQVKQGKGKAIRQDAFQNPILLKPSIR